MIDVSTERLRYSNGREYEIDFVRHPGAAAVVAVDAAGRVCVVRQYRHGVADFLWEVPAGKLDPGEAPRGVRSARARRGDRRDGAPLDAARHLRAGPSIFTEVIHLYLARDLEVGKAAPDADEELEIQWLPLERGDRTRARGRVERRQDRHGAAARLYIKCNCDAPPVSDPFGLTWPEHRLKRSYEYWRLEKGLKNGRRRDGGWRRGRCETGNRRARAVRDRQAERTRAIRRARQCGLGVGHRAPAPSAAKCPPSACRSWRIPGCRWPRMRRRPRSGSKPIPWAP